MRYSDLGGCVCIHAYRMQSASDLPDLVGAPVRCHVRRVCTAAFVLKCGRFPVVSVKVQGSAGIFFFSSQDSQLCSISAAVAGQPPSFSHFFCCSGNAHKGSLA